MQDTTSPLAPAEAHAELVEHVKTYTISPEMLDDAFFGISVMRADAALGCEATDAEAAAALSAPATVRDVMADVFAALGLPLPAWADPTQAGPSPA